jgi:hypothetical protein
MSNSEHDIDALRALIETHLQILAVTIKIADEGVVTYSEQKLVGTLPQAVIQVVAPMSLAVGGSVQSIFELTKGFTPAVRDCFPIVRSIVETMVNACYVLAGGSEVAEKAIRHAQQKYYRDMDRTWGQGDNLLRVHAVDVPNFKWDIDLAEALAEFTSKKGKEKNWTEDSVPVRITTIEKKLSLTIAKVLLGAYAIVYGDSSEITHGSLYGINLFFHGRGQSPKSQEDYQDLMRNHVRGIYYAVFFALTGYLRAVFHIQKHQSMIDLVEHQFGRFEAILVAT